MSFFDALVYTLAYLPVISALARIDNPLPMPTTVHELRGQSYMRHRPSYAGILHESRRRVATDLGTGEAGSHWMGRCDPPNSA